jgi:hypothetical protein
MAVAIDFGCGIGPKSILKGVLLFISVYNQAE